MARVLCLLVLLSGAARAAEPVVPSEALVLPPVGRWGRFPVRTDPVEAKLVAGVWTAPKTGDRVEPPGGPPRTWEKLAADEQGRFRHAALRGGYAFVSVRSDARRVMLLTARGHGMVYVNGEPRAGDPYATGRVRLPVELQAGDNGFLFHVLRGELRVALAPADAPAMLDLGDATLPDHLVGGAGSPWGAAVVINTTTAPLGGLTLDAAGVRTEVAELPPLTVRKVPFRLPEPTDATQPEHTFELRLERTADGRSGVVAAAPVTVRLRRPDELHRRTFLSGIDGSVQYYAVRPARPGPAGERSALVLTLHGAAVEAEGQAAAYSDKPWAHIVAPTNRRPFGFDWEDWGRLDAMEVLEHAAGALGADPARVYLTGHSMGGHGVWHIGATHPDRFAAIGPSAGWIAFSTYGGGPRPPDPDPVTAMLLRAALPGDTLTLSRNYARHGVYILHGAADDNVPVEQARFMSRHLGGFHRDHAYHEQPKAGHWWSDTDEPGAACVDWAPMFDFFARRRLPPPGGVRSVEFATAAPGVSSRCDWAAIHAQIKPFRPSTVRLRCDPHKRRFVGSTENVARLALDLSCLPAGGPVGVQLDGGRIDAIDPPADAVLHLTRGEKGWAVAGPAPAGEKNPRRGGPFRDAFRNRMIFVYGTRGTPEETAANYAKARFDAETWWVVGNGSADVRPDTAFDPAAEPDRNVIVYGNADTHGSWAALLGGSPLTVSRGRVGLGDRSWSGDDLCALFVRPRPGSAVASVGVVAGTGLPGMRLTGRMGWFVSGNAFPDALVASSQMLAGGVAGVRAAGFFGNDWTVPAGEWAW